MKILISTLLSGCMLLGGVAMVMAQNPNAQGNQSQRPWMQGAGQGQGQQGKAQQGRRGMRGAGQNQFRRMVPSAVATFFAIDKDKNGELSKEEIEGATAALQKLDTNKDGKLSFQELMKAVPKNMRRMGPPPGGPEGGPPPQGGMRGPGRGQGRGPGMGQGPPPEQGPPVETIEETEESE